MGDAAMPTLTVFTPAYNRAHTLPRTYQSLLSQDCKDFIWLIIDDGSEDNTAALVSGWQQADNGFEIRYVYKENGGMHTAHNTAYEIIDTELNVCLDSDDCMAEGAVGKILKKWDEVKDRGYAGIIALDADMNTGNVLGSGFPAGMNETTLTGYYRNGGAGDKKLIYRTDLIKSVPPYPVFSGEKYVALAYKYWLLDLQYQLAVLDEIVCLVEYLPSGSSGTMVKQYYRNPKGFAFWRKFCMEYPGISRKRLFIECTHYVSSSILSDNRRFVAESPRKGMTVLAIPCGWLLSLWIKRKANEKS